MVESLASGASQDGIGRKINLATRAASVDCSGERSAEGHRFGAGVPLGPSYAFPVLPPLPFPRDAVAMSN
jgi:hypothetical protein